MPMITNNQKKYIEEVASYGFKIMVFGKKNFVKRALMRKNSIKIMLIFQSKYLLIFRVPANWRRSGLFLKDQNKSKKLIRNADSSWIIQNLGTVTKYKILNISAMKIFLEAIQKKVNDDGLKNYFKNKNLDKIYDECDLKKSESESDSESCYISNTGIYDSKQYIREGRGFSVSKKLLSKITSFEYSMFEKLLNFFEKNRLLIRFKTYYSFYHSSEEPHEDGENGIDEFKMYLCELMDEVYAISGDYDGHIKFNYIEKYRY